MGKIQSQEYLTRKSIIQNRKGYKDFPKQTLKEFMKTFLVQIKERKDQNYSTKIGNKKVVKINISVKKIS